MCSFSSSPSLFHQLRYILFLHKGTGKRRIFWEALGWGDEEIQDTELKQGREWRQVKNSVPFPISGTFSSTWSVLPHSLVK